MATKQAAPALAEVQLDDNAQAIWDDYQRQKAIESKGNAAQRVAKGLKGDLQGLFGPARVGILPDGRRIIRTTKEVSYKAKKATTIAFDQFSEVQAGE